MLYRSIGPSCCGLYWLVYEHLQYPVRRTSFKPDDGHTKYVENHVRPCDEQSQYERPVQRPMSQSMLIRHPPSPVDHVFKGLAKAWDHMIFLYLLDSFEINPLLTHNVAPENNPETLWRFKIACTKFQMRTVKDHVELGCSDGILV
jgi:hypothetical protein